MNGAGLDLRSLDCLRGVLALYVVAGHARWLLWAGHKEWMATSPGGLELLLGWASAALRFGHEAVLVFFVLSGFFIHLRAAQALSSSQPVAFQTTLYVRRRLHRLVPPYAMALAMTFGVDMAAMQIWPKLYEANSGDPLLDFTFSRGGYSPESVWPALGLLPSSLGRHFGSNGPLWSLGYEAVYYAAYPLWVALRKQGSLVAYGLPFVLALSLSAWPIQGFLGAVMEKYPLWIAGAGLAELSCRGRLSRPRRLIISVAMAGAATLLFFPALHMLGLVALGTSIVLFAGSTIARYHHHPLFQLAEELGIRSYTIYMCHFPLLTALAAWCVQERGARPTAGWLALGGALLAVAISILLFQVCERHFLHQRIRVEPWPVGPK